LCPHAGVDFGNRNRTRRERLALVEQILDQETSVRATAEHIHNNIRIEKKWSHRSVVAELLFEPHLRLLAQFLDPSPRPIPEFGMISVFPTSCGQTESVTLPDKQKLLADGVRYELTAISLVDEPIEIGTNVF
jgi:hypothetical protein